MKTIIAVAVGGMVGTILRYSLNLATVAADYPIGALLENLIGSFALGVLTGFFVIHSSKQWVKAGLGVGLCGGFTTFSTFAADSTHLYVDSGVLAFFLYTGVSMFGGICLAMMGYLLGQNAATKRKERKVSES